ncbi:hypothetical protein ABPG72_012552 [Tetrahymena utriculariae]
MRSFNNSVDEQQKSLKSDSIKEDSKIISSKIDDTQNQQLSNNSNNNNIADHNLSEQRSKSQSSFIKPQVSNRSIPIANQSYNYQLSVNRRNNNRTQTSLENPLKKPQFHIQNYSGYRRYEEPVMLNKDKNFMPLSNHLSSSEILFNSAIYQKKYNENDSTKASILMNLNTTLSDLSKSQSLLIQKPIKQQLDIIDEQINLENQRKELQKFSFQRDQIEQPYQRRASEILEEAARQLEEEKNRPKPSEIHVIVNPYEITRQDILEKMINKDKQMRDQEESIKAKELQKAKNKQAKDLLKFLGMKLPSDDEDDEENEEEEKQIEKDKSFNKFALNPQIPSNSNSQTNLTEEPSNDVTKSFFIRKPKKRQITRVVDIINSMNSKTPQEQRIQMIKGENALVVKSQKNSKSTTKVEFEEDQQQQENKTQKLIRGSQTSIQLLNQKSNTDIKSEKQNIKPISDVQSPLYEQTITDIEDTKSVQLQMEQFLNRRTLKQSFRLPLRYNSAIIQRAFEKQGQTYISKWLSHTTFTQTDIAENEEDVDQTVIKNAAPGQQVILIETKPQVIKGRLNKFGKYKRRLRESMTNFEDEDEDPEQVINKANSINRKEVLKKRMRIQANVESKKEKELAKRGRENQIQTDIPESKWEQKMVQLGKRKVRFKIENDLCQPDLDVGPDTIFKNPTFFRGLQTPKSGTQTLTSVSQSLASFAQIDFEQESKSHYALDDKYNLMDVFSELYMGGDRKDYKLKQQWVEFLIQKDKMIDAFERMDGLRYKYPLQKKIEQDVRNQQIYDDIIKENEEEEKVWKPDDQPQTDPPDQLKEFLIEPNILVYCKNILDLDMNYNKNKLQKEQELTNKRRVAKYGLADQQTQAHQIAQLMDQSSKPSRDTNGNREIFDFMYKNYGDLPFVPMKTLQRIQDENEQKQKISQLEKILFEQTPAIPNNIHTNNNLFLVKEVNEYENELRQKKIYKESLSRVNSQSQLQEDISHKDFEEANQKQKIQAQINSVVASVNPINFQFVSNDIKQKSIIKGVENVATKSFKNFSKFQDISRQTNSQIEAPSIQQTQKNILQSQVDNKTQFQIESLQQINEPQQQQQIQKSNISNREQQIKTLKDLNEMYTTPGQLISQTLKTIKSFNKQQNSHENLLLDFKKNTNTSFNSNPDEAKQVIKNQYYVDHGSHLLNTQYDYNIPEHYHKREAEQGLFYLSKNYRDYFEPARDVFAEKDGWDILDQFAKNPRNLKTEKPQIHTYSQQKQFHDENDILTAFHGISVMNNCNKLFNDVEKRNEDNFRRRIYYNSSQ